MLTILLILLYTALFFTLTCALAHATVLLCDCDHLWHAVHAGYAVALYFALPLAVNVRAVREWSLNNFVARSVAHFELDARSRRTLRLLRRATRRANAPSCVFAVEPHGYACLSVAVLWCGYAQHSVVRQALGVRFMRRTRIVGHWLAQRVPLLRRIYAAYGVIGCTAAEFDAALADGKHLVLLPGGWAGKRDAMQREPLERDAVRVLKRPLRRSGFLALAARRGALVVPVLAVDEARAFRAKGPAWLHWLLRWPHWHALGDARPMRVVCAPPIDTRRFPNQINRLHALYYNSLALLAAKHGVKLHVEEMQL